MPPSKVLQMRKPFDPSKAVDQDIYNKIEEEKLKRPKPSPYVPALFPQVPQFNGAVEYPKVFEAIKNRLAGFSPPILLDEHIVHSEEKLKKIGDYLPVKTYRNTLNGIDFIVEDREKFLSAVKQAKTDGKCAFIEGSKNDWQKHWALTISFKATDGIGFREIFRPQVVERPIENNNSIPYDSRLGTDVTVDISALHIAVAEFIKYDVTRCNIHIDNLTVTLGGIGDDVGISPTVISHFVNELLFKTKLQGKLPDWVIDAFDISLLNPNDGFLSAGIGLTLINKPNLKWTIKYSAGLNNSTNPEWSGNFKVEHSGGMSLVITF